MAKVKHLIIDGNNLFYRGFYIGKPLVDSDGNNVNGIFQFMKMLHVLLTKFNTKYCTVAWDLGRSKRYELFPEYKSGRRSSLTPEQIKNIAWQIGMVQSILESLPVRQVKVEDIEADDIIGYLTDKIKGSKMIISNDHDLLQLITKETSVYLPKDAKIIKYKNLDKFLQIPKERYILYKAIVGDSSDKIPGIKGMGPKRTIDLLSQKKYKINEEWKPIIDRNIQLMTVGLILSDKDRKVIYRTYKKQKKKPINPLMPRRVFTNLKFRSIVMRYSQWVSPFRKLGIRHGK